jgi:hypothetical protein
MRRADRELTALITDFLEHRLTTWQWLRFQVHLGLCFECRVYLSQMRQTIRALGALPADDPPAELNAELLRRFRDWRG